LREFFLPISTRSPGDFSLPSVHDMKFYFESSR
jgi:hypothetical protein